jgi:hypothetical protein
MSFLVAGIFLEPSRLNSSRQILVEIALKAKIDETDGTSEIVEGGHSRDLRWQ